MTRTVSEKFEARFALFIALVSLGLAGYSSCSTLRSSSSDAISLLANAEIAMDQGDLASAEYRLDEAAALGRRPNIVRLVRGRLLALKGEPDEAREQYRLASTRVPLAHLRHGELLEQAGDFAQAREEIQKALQAAESADRDTPASFRLPRVAALVALGHAYLASQDLEFRDRLNQAEQYCGEAVRDYEWDSGAHACLGDVYLKYNEILPAIRQYEKVVELASGNARYRQKLSALYDLYGKPDKAKSVLQE